MAEIRAGSTGAVQTATQQHKTPIDMAAPPKPLSVDIHTSVKEGDIAKVLEFLEEGGDVNVRCRYVLYWTERNRAVRYDTPGCFIAQMQAPRHQGAVVSG